MNKLSKIEECFPFFRKNPEITYLDYAATTFMPDQVLNAWQDYQKDVGISEGRNNSRLGKEATTLLQSARENIKSFFNCSESHELIFVKNATEALNVIAWGFGRYVKPGDIIVLSALEHHSNYLPWQRLASMHKGQLVELPLVCGLPDIEILENYLKDKIRIISITHTSNVTGVQPDITKIVNIAAQADAFSVLDATQAAGHGRLQSDVFKFDCVALSAHKMYGPRNIGGLFVKKSLLPAIEPFILGGGMVWHAGNLPTWMDDHRRLEAGTFDPGLAVAWETCCKFLDSIGMDNIAKAEEKTGLYLRNGLSNLGMTLFGNPDKASPAIVAFIHPELHAHDLEERLSKAETIIRSGHLCAQNALQHLGVQAINRVSIGLGVNKSQIDHFLDLLSGYSKDSTSKITQIVEREAFLERLVEDRRGRHIISPDLALVSDGIACGDSIILEIINDAGKCYFNCSVTGCLYCRASAALMEKLNGHSIMEISEYARDFIHFIENGELQKKFPLDMEEWQNWKYPTSRMECILAPWRLLAGIEWKCEQSAQNFSEYVPLACEACITANKIEWGLKKPIKKSGLSVRLCNLAKLIWQLDNKRDIELQALARLEPSEKQQLQEKFMSENFKYDYLSALKTLKIAAPIYNNLIDYSSTPIPPELHTLVTSLRMRKIILDREYDRINTTIADNRWQIIPVKGAVTSSLYSKRHLRAHLDYDFVALSGIDAFKLAIWLIQNDYHFICDGSVPLSVRMADKGRRQFSGHFHLEKIIYDKYQMIVDFNFPGFPSGVGNYIPCSFDEEIKWEQQFIITLCHTFKHDRVYIKDINDIVMMLRANLIKNEYLYNLVYLNKLDFYFILLAKYIEINYGINIIINNTCSAATLIICDLLIWFGWPYSRKAHLYAKCIGEFYYRKKYLKREKTVSRIQLIPSALNRLYLFPLIIFNKYMDYDKNKFSKFEQLSDGIIHIIKYKNIDLALVPLGIFLTSSENTVTSDKILVTKAIEDLIKIFGIKDKDIAHGAIREARKDLWLF